LRKSRLLKADFNRKSPALLQGFFKG